MDRSKNPINVLCIGSTGMLAGMTRELVISGHCVYAIARTAESLDRCASGIPEESSGSFIGYQCNYEHPDAWKRMLNEIPDPIDKVVCWIHSSAPEAFDQLCKRFPDSDILKVGSSSTSPKVASTQKHRTVILGAVPAGETSRWLTHQEISSGVMDAIWNADRVTVVGVLGSQVD